MTRAVYNDKPLWVRFLKGLGISAILLAKSIEEPEVNGDIDDGNHGAKEILYLSCETIRIDDAKQVVFHEALTISGSSRLDTKCVLQTG